MSDRAPQVAQPAVEHGPMNPRLTARRRACVAGTVLVLAATLAAGGNTGDYQGMVPLDGHFFGLSFVLAQPLDGANFELSHVPLLLPKTDSS